MILVNFLRRLGQVLGRGQVHLMHVSHAATLWPPFLSPYKAPNDILGPKHHKDFGLSFSKTNLLVTKSKVYK